MPSGKKRKGHKMATHKNRPVEVASAPAAKPPPARPVLFFNDHTAIQAYLKDGRTGIPEAPAAQTTPP